MEVLKTLKVKNLNGTFEQITPIGTETEYVSRKWVNPDSGNTEEITLEQSLSLIEQDIDRINGDAETVGSIDAKINQAKEDLIGEASEVYNTFEKVQNQVEKNIKGEGLVEGDEENLYNTLYKVNNKLNQLDGSVSIDGSIKQQISAAINNLKGDASTAMDTLEEIEILFNSIKSNEEEGLDSLSELASVYTQLKTLIAELPDQYKNSTVIQYVQTLVNSENNRAVTAENSIKADIAKHSNRLGAIESKITAFDTLTGNHNTKIAALESTTNNHTTLINQQQAQISNHTTQISNLNNSQKAHTVKTTTGPNNEITFILHWQNNLLNIFLDGVLGDSWVSGQSYVSLGSLSEYNITLRPSYQIRRYVVINRYTVGILRISTSGTISLGYIFNIGDSKEASLTGGDNIRIDEVFFLGAGAEGGITTEEGA